MTDLIKQVGGLREAKKILAGSPALECFYIPNYRRYFVNKSGFIYVLGLFGYFAPSLGMSEEYLNNNGFSMRDLRQAIADYNTDHCGDIINHVSPSTQVYDK